jgi:hypothetical protein
MIYLHANSYVTNSNGSVMAKKPEDNTEFEGPPRLSFTIYKKKLPMQHNRGKVNLIKIP